MVAEASTRLDGGSSEASDMPPLLYSHTGPQSAGNSKSVSGLKSSIHTSNEGTFRPKGQWKKKSGGDSGGGTSTTGKGQQGGRASRLSPQDENRIDRSSAFPSTSRSTKADVFTLPDRGPAEEVPVLMSPDGGGWGLPPSSSVAPSGRDVHSRRSQLSTQGSRDVPSSRTGGARRSNLAKPPKPGTLLEPLGNSAQHQQLPRDAPRDWMEASPPRNGGSTLAPIHFVPATQFLEPQPDQVDLLTLSPSKAQERLQRERNKRQSFGKDRRSSLSKGISASDSLRSSAELTEEIMGSSLRSNSSADGCLPHRQASQDLHRQAVMGSSNFDSNDLLSVKLSRMSDQANAIEAKLQARSDTIIRQIDFAMPGMHL